MNRDRPSLLRTTLRDPGIVLRATVLSLLVRKFLLGALELAEGRTRVVVAEEGRLRQVVINLLANAIKFTSEGGVRSRLATRPSAGSPRATLVIEVVDTGDGIAAEDHQRIFAPAVGRPKKSLEVRRT